MCQVLALGKMRLPCGLLLVFCSVELLKQALSKSYTQLQWNKCGTNHRRTMAPSTLTDCIQSCARRGYCLLISYSTSYRICRLHDNVVTQDGSCRGFVFIYKEHFNLAEMKKHPEIACLPDQVREDTCVYRECQHIPNVPGAVTYGNMMHVGAKVKYVCEKDGSVSYITCGNDGNWSSLPECQKASAYGQSCSQDADCTGKNTHCYNIGAAGRTVCDCQDGYTYNKQQQTCEGCGSFSLQLHNSLSRLASADVITVSCTEGYALYPDDCSNTSACLSNGTWEYVNPNMSCKPDTIGRTCESDGDCKESNSRCLNVTTNIHKNGTYGRRCYCNILYEYDKQTRPCEKECLSYTDDFEEMNNINIKGHILESMIVHRLAECAKHCFDKFDAQCPAFSSNAPTKTIERTVSLFTCRCLSATPQQVNVSSPHLILTDENINWKLYTRKC